MEVELWIKSENYFIIKKTFLSSWTCSFINNQMIV